MLVGRDRRSYLGRFHHIGIVVGDIEKTLSKFSSISSFTFDPLQNVHVGFTDICGISIEMIQSGKGESPVSNSLKTGQKLLHLCFEVAEIYKALEFARKDGALVIAEPVAAVAFDSRKIAWIFFQDIGLVELLEADSERRD